MRKTVTRREILRLGAVATGSLVVGRFSSGVRAATSERKPKSLTVAVQAFAHSALRPVVAEWEQKTGISVRLEPGPATGHEVLTKYAPAFQSRTSPVDIISLDDVAGPLMARAGWLAPLDDAISTETWNDFPPSFLPPVDQDPFHSYAGKRYRIPHEFAIGYFWYRKDWFDAKGVPVPKTWEEFVLAAKEFTTGTVWGTVEGMKRPGLTFVYLAYLAAQAGGEIFKFDDNTAEALKFAYDLIHTHRVMPESVLTMDYTQQNDMYMKDRVAMMRQWPYFWGVARGNTAWYRPDRAAISLPPAGPAGSKTWVGGWGWSVPKYTPYLDEAMDLLQWLTDNRNAVILARGQSWFIMPRRSILAEMSNDPFVRYMKQYLDAGVVVQRPYHPRQAEAETVVDEIGQLYLTKQVSLSQALKLGRERIAALG